MGWMLEERCWGAEMATAKRIPKRSIIGSRVAVQCLDRMWRCGVVAAMRSTADCLLSSEKKFSVRLEGLGTVLECREADIVGPGFLSVLPANTRLREGQVGLPAATVDRLLEEISHGIGA